MTTEEKKIFEQVVDALQEASSHLDYCGYGDSWEREGAYDQKLPEKISTALMAAEKLNG